MIKIIAFGQISEIIPTGTETTAMETDMLKAELEQRFPKLAEKKYAVAVNKKLVNSNCILKDNDEVALMPPYSGG